MIQIDQYMTFTLQKTILTAGPACIKEFSEVRGSIQNKQFVLDKFSRVSCSNFSMHAEQEQNRN